ncbi:MAG: MFS transporter [Pseudomonadota bacterium]
MTADLSHTSEKTVFDGWRAISIALYMSVVGYGVLVGIPVINTAWVDMLGFSEVQVGRVSGADLGGLALGAVLTALVLASVNRRLLAVVGGGIAIAANLLCMGYVEYEQVLYLRLVAGIGSGIYTAVAVATLGAHSRPAFAFNLMLFAFVFSQTIELWFLQRLSMNGIYLAFAICFCLGLLFLVWLPPRPNKSKQKPSAKASAELVSIPPYVPWMVLAAIVSTYVNIGAYWAYIELAGRDGGVDEDWLGNILVFASFASGLGCLLATVLSNRFGLARPLLLALVSHAAIAAMLALGMNKTIVFVSVYSFNFLWIFIDVYQMSTVANVDPTGRFASLLPAAQGLGQILGPNIAATILARGLGYEGVFIMCGIASLVGMLLYATMYIRLRQVIPQLADAS